jgi:hypothetical protein
MRLHKIACWSTALFIALHVSTPSRSQGSDTSPPPAGSEPAQVPTAAAAPVPDQPPLKPAELDGLVAPIALYPDALLANVLMASTYPLEVVRAERWLNQNKSLKNDKLKAAAEKQDWDASVKSLVAAPSVLQMMSERLEWTEKLGEAFLAQEQDVMDAVQRLRARAYERQKLVTTKEQVVTAKQEQNRQVFLIEPAVPDTIYVPYYEPQVVYGDWPYTDYPAYPYYWGYPGYIAAGVIATGLAFGGAYALGRWASGGYWGRGGYWGGSRINWAGGGINVNRGARVEHWSHNPAHRQGGRYNDANLQQRFGSANRAVGAGANRQRAAAGASRSNVGGREQRADRGRTNGQAGGGRTAGNRTSARSPSAAARNVTSARTAARPAQRAVSRAGHSRPTANSHSGGGARFAGGGGQAAAFRGGGSFHGGGGARGGGGGGGRGGGRRSDIRLKHDIILLGWLNNGLGYYRFAYNGSEKTYVGVMAQEVRAVRPDAVTVGRDGYRRVSYESLALPFRTYDQWIQSGSRLPIPAAARTSRILQSRSDLDTHSQTNGL